MTTKPTKHYPGCYRVPTLRGFAQIKKQNNGSWMVELRNSDGSLARFAGTWPTLKAAVEEVNDQT
jgi:hypothetical protein